MTTIHSGSKVERVLDRWAGAIMRLHRLMALPVIAPSPRAAGARLLRPIPRTLPAQNWSRGRGQNGLAVLPAIETWLADHEAFERQVHAAVPGGSAALAAPSPRMLTARRAPPPATRGASTHS